MTAATHDMALTPVGESDRLELIDVLRGFALLGILLVNFWGNEAPEGMMRAIDSAASEVLDVLISSSFYPLFSFLFGLGFAVQLLRARARGSGVTLVYLRRMMALLLIGAFHAIVIWNGDILLDYAIIGLLLIPLHRLGDRWLVGVVLLLYAMSLGGQPMRARLLRLGTSDTNARAAELEQVARNQLGASTNALRQRIELNEAGAGEAFRATITANWQAYSSTVRNRFSRNLFFSDILLYFIVGLVVGRRRWLEDPSRYRRGFAWAAGTGLVATLAGNILTYTVEPSGSSVWGRLTWDATNLGLTVFYVSSFAVAFAHWPRVVAALRVFAAPGRIGLTNYLMQSVVMTLLFAKYGFRIDEPGTTLWILVNLVFFFAVQVPVSRWWVPRFHFGPAEWVWRSMTYGTLQAMRRVAPVAIPAGATGVPTASVPDRSSTRAGA